MEQIIITHPDGKQMPLFSRKNISGASKATQKTALLSDDTVSITVSSSVPLDLGIGDTVQIYGKPYKLNQLPEPTKDGERRYTYELRLEGLQYDLIDVHYHLPEDAYGETYYSDLAGHLRILIWNINRIFPNKWALGSCPEETEYKNITNSEKNCLQVLQELCSDYGVEFEITTDGTKNTIDIKEQAGKTHAFTLRFGRGKGLYQLQRKNVNNAGITNRLYVYGSTENLGRNYGHTKLLLPGTTRLTSYIEDKESIALYGVKEGEKNYSDIKPQRVGTVTALGSNVITFADSTMFDLNAKESDGKTTKYLIDGTSAKVKFESGQLAGYEFDLHSYDHATHTFIINKFQDENGLVFPSEDSGAFQISAGDKYSLSGINLPDEYKQTAESELEEAGNEYLPTVSQPQVSYKLDLTEGFFDALWGKEVETEVLHVGDYINIEDEQIGVNKAVRITEIERDLLKRHGYKITLSDTVTKTVTVRVMNELRNLNEVVAMNRLADPAKARRRWMATQELLNMVFDPEGDYYSDKIKPLSIETQMLSVGAKSTQFALIGVTFQPNYGGNANALYVSSGRLAHYAIDADSVRYWTLDGATYSDLAADTAYYIYARCSRTGSTGTIILSETAKTVESETDCYNFLVGVLNSAVTDTDGNNPARLVSLTYGSSTINGRFVKTGRIESNAGTCYFDLDNNEIGGFIKFVKKDGSTSNVADVDEKASEAKCYIDDKQPDNTQTAIDGGIVTAGTVQLAGDDTAVKAGMTGDGTEDKSVRFWAGAIKEDRENAPFRVLQDGSLVSTKADIDGDITAKSGETEVHISATEGREGMTVSYDGVQKTEFVGADKTAAELFKDEAADFALTAAATNKAEVKEDDIRDGTIFGTGSNYGDWHCAFGNMQTAYTQGNSFPDDADLLKNVGDAYKTFTVGRYSRVTFAPTGSGYIMQNSIYVMGNAYSSELYADMRLVAENEKGVSYDIHRMDGIAMSGGNMQDSDNRLTESWSGTSLYMQPGTYTLRCWGNAEIQLSYQDKDTCRDMVVTNSIGPVKVNVDPVVYQSTFFGNGFAFGISGLHHFQAVCEDGAMQIEGVSGNAGFRIKDGTLELRIGGTWYACSRNSSTGALTLTAS